MDTLKIFQCISLFVKELSDSYGKTHHPVALYNRLLEKTPVTNMLAIQKQVSIFYDFCKRNKESIMTKNKGQIQERIIFSKKIYIEIRDILNKSDAETEDIIWRHLLLISFHMFQTDDIKQIIKNISSSSSGESGETKSEENFISNFMTKIENQFKDKQFSDPMTATTELLQSGLFTEMVSTMNTEIQSGNLNIAKLLGSVQGMMGNISGEVNSSAQGSNMINNMMSNMMGMMGNMGNLMGNMGGMNVEEQLQRIEEATEGTEGTEGTEETEGAETD